MSWLDKMPARCRSHGHGHGGCMGTHWNPHPEAFLESHHEEQQQQDQQVEGFTIGQCILESS